MAEEQEIADEFWVLKTFLRSKGVLDIELEHHVDRLANRVRTALVTQEARFV